MIRRPDKEDNIRIEAMAEAPQGQAPQEKRSYPPRREAGAADRGPRHHDGPRHEPAPKPYAKPYAKPHGDQDAGSRTSRAIRTSPLTRESRRMTERRRKTCVRKEAQKEVSRRAG